MIIMPRNYNEWVPKKNFEYVNMLKLLMPPLDPPPPSESKYFFYTA